MSSLTLLNSERVAIINQYATQLGTEEQEVLIKVLRRMAGKAAARRVDQATKNVKPLTEAEILAEINAYRQEKQKAEKA